MTADVEMLPELVDEGLYYFDKSGDEGDKLYVRAIRQHIAAKDAEIEALRAEVEFLRRGIVPRDDDMIVPAKLLDEINASGAEWKDRAEQLAEANEKLRHAGALLSNIAYNLAQDDRLPDGMRWSLDDARKRWDAALNRAALEQESNDA